MTTEGGGAIAFPVMTLALNISPVIARDFSMMIQSCGLTSASFTIFFRRIRVERHSLIFTTIGAIFGIIFGLQVIDPLLSAAAKKMAFVSIFFSFAIALYILNLEKKRITFNQIQQFSRIKALILIANGFVGGIFTAIVGSGVDVYSFSILTLLFRISEKVATPTSVVLMALNSIVGFFWRFFILNAIQPVTWEYLSVSVPIVVITAPLGSVVASYLHRLTLATVIYILEIIALVSALAIIRPSLPLLLASFSLILIAFIFYSLLSHLGKKMIDLDFDHRATMTATTAAAAVENTKIPTKTESTAKICDSDELI